MTNGILDSGQKIVTDGLVLNYDVAQLRSYPTTGTSLTDLSGNNNTGTLVNGVAYNSINGGSLVFDGVNDYVQSINISNISGNQPRSLISWCKFNNITSSVVASIGTGNNTNNSIFELQAYQNKLIGHFIGPNYINGITNLSTGIWYHASLVYNGTTAVLYLNSLVQGSLVTTLNTVNTSLYVGKPTFPTNVNMNGNISQIQIYNIALSSTEILQNFNANRSRYGL